MYYPNGTERDFNNKFEVTESLRSNGLPINTPGETFVKGLRIVGKIIPITFDLKAESSHTTRENMKGIAYEVTDMRKGAVYNYASGRDAAAAIGMIYSTFRSRTRKYSFFAYDQYVVETKNNKDNRPARGDVVPV